MLMSMAIPKRNECDLQMITYDARTTALKMPRLIIASPHLPSISASYFRLINDNLRCHRHRSRASQNGRHLPRMHVSARHERAVMATPTCVWNDFFVTEVMGHWTLDADYVAEDSSQR